MREFGKNGFSLRGAPVGLRVVYGGFLLLIVPGLVSQAAFHVGRIGLSPSRIAAYYRGGDDGAVMTFPKTFGQLLEVTHAHAFTMSVVFLILAHLFAASAVGDGTKRAVLAAAFVGLVGDLAAPWLVRYGAAWWAWIALLAWTLESAGMLTLVAVSGWECLGRVSRSSSRG
jgi:hypothetical protein